MRLSFPSYPFQQLVLSVILILTIPVRFSDTSTNFNFHFPNDKMMMNMFI